MDSIKERLHKLKTDAKERSKHLALAVESDKKTHHYSSTICISSDSNSTNTGENSKTTISSSIINDGTRDLHPLKHDDKLHTVELSMKPEQQNILKSWKSESAVDFTPKKSTKNLLFKEHAPCMKTYRGEQQEETNEQQCNRQHQIMARSNSTRSINHTRMLRIKGKEYAILNNIGKGGTSMVYQAYSGYHRQCVAIKIVNLTEADETLRNAYENEIKLLEQLQGSDHVIKMFDHEKFKNKLYVVMECGDIDLGKFMQNRADQIDDKFIKYHWQEMLKCVKVIHDRNIVHSDLKPANFLFVGASLKLIDFGIASNIPSNKTSVVKGISVGTINFISPEAISESYTDEQGTIIYKIPLKSDVWSLGCMLYAMVYGHPPFYHLQKQSAKILAITSDEHVIDFPKNSKTRDRLLLDVLKKCLVRDVKKRANIDELLRHPYLRGASQTTPSPARCVLKEIRF